jgi:hypothetical protein
MTVDIVEQLTQKIKESDFIAVQSDEQTYSSNMVQFSCFVIYIRWIHQGNDAFCKPAHGHALGQSSSPSSVALQSL